MSLAYRRLPFPRRSFSRLYRPIRNPCHPRDPWLASRPNIRVYSWLAFLRECLKGWDRLIDHNPGQFIFKPNRFLRRKRRRIVERCNREIDRVGIFAVFEKQMRAATRGKRANPIRVRNFARFRPLLRLDSRVALIPTAHRAPPRFFGNRCNDNRPAQLADSSTRIVSRRKHIHQLAP